VQKLTEKSKMALRLAAGAPKLGLESGFLHLGRG
jgi:hypothetical protein